LHKAESRRDVSSLGWNPEPDLKPNKHSRPISALLRNAETGLVPPDLRIKTDDIERGSFIYQIDSPVEAPVKSEDCWTLRDDVYILREEDQGGVKSEPMLVVPSSPPGRARKTEEVGKEKLKRVSSFLPVW
jgi:hypothetical protein